MKHCKASKVNRGAIVGKGWLSLVLRDSRGIINMAGDDDDGYAADMYQRVET